MQKKSILVVVTFLFSSLVVIFCYADLPSSDNYILQQQVFASGNDPANPPTSTNYILIGSAICNISDEDAVSANYNLIPGYYLGPIVDGIFPPGNVIITVENYSVNISWTASAGATSYKVYSSDNPYIGFIEDTTGTFVDESWSAPVSYEKKFYYVTAMD